MKIAVSICLVFLLSWIGFAEETILSSLTSKVSYDPSLISNLKGRGIAIRLTVSNLEFERIKEEDILFSSAQSLRLAPDIVLMWSWSEIGFAIGYESTFEGKADLNVLKTISDYMVNERRFTSRTDLNLDYRILVKRGLTVRVGKKVRGVELGCNISLQRQTLKKGRIVSEMKLTAEHGEDVNPNDPRQLIPAIVDNLKYSLNGEDQLEKDESEQGINADLAVGIRPKGFEEFRVGVIFRNLLSPQMPSPSRSGLALYGTWKPKRWIEFNLGAEKLLSERFQPWFGFRLIADQGGIGGALIGGWTLDKDGTKKAAVGLDLILGGSRFSLSALLSRGLPAIMVLQEHRF